MVEGRTVDQFVKPSEVKFFDGPTAYASTLQASFVGNDLVLVMWRPRLGAAMTDGKVEPVASPEVSAIIHMSPGTAKDLMLALQDQIRQFEANWGPIQTEFSRAATAPRR